jgi:hypothetical protein
VSNLAAFFALHLHLQEQNPPHKRNVRIPQGLFTIHLVAIFWLKNAPAALKMLARCSTLLCFSPCSHAFALKILRTGEM